MPPEFLSSRIPQVEWSTTAAVAEKCAVIFQFLWGKPACSSSRKVDLAAFSTGLTQAKKCLACSLIVILAIKPPISADIVFEGNVIIGMQQILQVQLQESPFCAEITASSSSATIILKCQKKLAPPHYYVIYAVSKAISQYREMLLAFLAIYGIAVRCHIVCEKSWWCTNRFFFRPINVAVPDIYDLLLYIYRRLSPFFLNDSILLCWRRSQLAATLEIGAGPPIFWPFLSSFSCLQRVRGSAKHSHPWNIPTQRIGPP